MILVTVMPGFQMQAEAGAALLYAFGHGCPREVTSALRSHQEQVALFLKNYQTVRVAYGPGEYDRRIWNGTAYWRKPGGVDVAVPGTSRHESGIAVDLGRNAAAWMRANPGYGFDPTVDSEWWHFEYDRSLNTVMNQEDDMTPEQAKMLAEVHAAVISGDDTAINWAKWTGKRVGGSTSAATVTDMLRASSLREKQTLEAVLAEHVPADQAKAIVDEFAARLANN